MRMTLILTIESCRLPPIRDKNLTVLWWKIACTLMHETINFLAQILVSLILVPLLTLCLLLGVATVTEITREFPHMALHKSENVTRVQSSSLFVMGFFFYFNDFQMFINVIAPLSLKRHLCQKKIFLLVCNERK